MTYWPLSKLICKSKPPKQLPNLNKIFFKFFRKKKMEHAPKKGLYVILQFVILQLGFLAIKSCKKAYTANAFLQLTFFVF